jgi:hypothetical protein
MHAERPPVLLYLAALHRRRRAGAAVGGRGRRGHGLAALPGVCLPGRVLLQELDQLWRAGCFGARHLFARFGRAAVPAAAVVHAGRLGLRPCLGRLPGLQGAAVQSARLVPGLVPAARQPRRHRTVQQCHPGPGRRALGLFEHHLDGAAGLADAAVVPHERACDRVFALHPAGRPGARLLRPAALGGVRGRPEQCVRQHERDQDQADLLRHQRQPAVHHRLRHRRRQPVPGGQGQALSVLDPGRLGHAGRHRGLHRAVLSPQRLDRLHAGRPDRHDALPHAAPHTDDRAGHAGGRRRPAVRGHQAPGPDQGRGQRPVEPVLRHGVEALRRRERTRARTEIRDGRFLLAPVHRHRQLGPLFRLPADFLAGRPGRRPVPAQRRPAHRPEIRPAGPDPAGRHHLGFLRLQPPCAAPLAARTAGPGHGRRRRAGLHAARPAGRHAVPAAAHDPDAGAVPGLALRGDGGGPASGSGGAGGQAARRYGLAPAPSRYPVHA